MISNIVSNILMTIAGIGYLPPNPSFNQDIRPIFEQYCTKCHEDRWTKYSNVEAYIKVIEKRVVIEKSMPPFEDIGPINREIIKTWIKKGYQED